MQLREIAGRCQKGDREAFALLYTATCQQLRAVCLRYVQNESVADDLVHDAFLLIFSKIGELKDTARTEAWMKMVARRVALLYLRQQKQQRQVSLSSCAATSLQSLTVENRAEPMLAFQEIHTAVDALPEGYRRVFRLSVLEGMTHQEIAALLHIEPHSSSSQLYHAKALLRHWLRPMLLLLLAVALPVSIYRWLQRPTLTLPEGQEAHPSPPEGRDVRYRKLPPFPATSSNPTFPPSEGPGEALPIAMSIGQDTLSKARSEEEVAVASQFPSSQDENPQPEVAASDGVGESVGRKEVSDFSIEYPLEELTTEKNQPCWHLQLAYSNLNDSRSMQLPYADAETNPTVFDSIAHHQLPLTLSLSVNYRLNLHWQLGTGLNYTRLTSDFCSGNSYVSLQQHQTLQYLGIPVSASYHLPLAKRLHIYASASATLHLPLHSTLESHYLLPDGTKAEATTAQLHPDVQWSVGLGLGVQYDLTPHVSFFVQPSLQHYFGNSSDVTNWNTEHPFTLSLPFGLKFSF